MIDKKPIHKTGSQSTEQTRCGLHAVDEIRASVLWKNITCKRCLKAREKE